MIQSKRGVLTGLKRNPRGQSSYDSLLERNYMSELETMGGVVSWTKDHDIRIPYRIFGLILRNYVPDFLVTFADGSKELHETKGAGFLFWLETHAKRRAADAWCRKAEMRYRLIENSRGTMFATNNALAETERLAGRKRTTNSLDDLMK